MTDYFNLSGLEHIYKSTLESYDKSFAFNINYWKRSISSHDVYICRR